jgi:hypothetical protein
MLTDYMKFVQHQELTMQVLMEMGVVHTEKTGAMSLPQFVVFRVKL